MSIVTERVFGFKMLWDDGYSVINWSEHTDFEAFMKPILARHTGTFLDGGCNVGFHTLSAVSTGLDVIAVDANYRNAAMLNKSLELNEISNVKVLPYSLGDCNGMTTFDDSLSNSRVGFVDGLMVPQITIDAVIQRYAHNPVSIIKLDLEGHEWWALKGAAKTLKKLKPTIIFEHKLGALEDRRTFDLLEIAGYKKEVIARHGNRYAESYSGPISNDNEVLYMYEAKHHSK